MKWRYRVKWNRIPEYMREGIALYVERGYRPGDFLYSILCNDLRGAAGHADDTNRYLLYDYVAFFHAFAPTGCWGGPSTVHSWIQAGGLEGLETTARQEQQDGRHDAEQVDG